MINDLRPIHQRWVCWVCMKNLFRPKICFLGSPKWRDIIVNLRYSNTLNIIQAWVNIHHKNKIKLRYEFLYRKCVKKVSIFWLPQFTRWILRISKIIYVKSSYSRFEDRYYVEKSSEKRLPYSHVTMTILLMRHLKRNWVKAIGK